MSVVSMVVGATGADGATFVAKVDLGGPVRVAVATDAAMTSPVFTSSQAVDAQGVAKVAITGLAPSTRHWWEVEDNSVQDTSVTGQFVTHPAVGASANFTVGLASCSGSGPDFPGDAGGELAANRVSNSPVFNTIRQQALDEGWISFMHMGDLHYYDLGSDNHGIVGGGSLSNYRDGYDDVLAQSNQGALYRDVAWTYVWDDHDFGPNDSDGTLPDKANAADAYRERVPHYPLTDPDGIWQSWQIGRVLFIASDTRYYRSPNSDPDGPSKTMLGAAQKAWMSGLLSTTSAEALVWITPSQWLGSPAGSDSWGNFATERDEMVSTLAATGWLSRMVMVYGDRHGVGINSGATNPSGGFPIMQAAALDSAPSAVSIADRFDIVPDTPGRAQYGTLTVNDVGNLISITLTAWRDGVALGGHTHGIGLPAAPVSSGALLSTLTGSHRIVIDARVVTSFQSGDDPDGETLDVIGGSVVLDGTAQVRGMADVEIPGVDDLGDSVFPRAKNTLLNPLTGNEVFIRYGLDLGGAGVLWTPLGYFRLSDVGQLQAPDGPIMLDCEDRMATIRDSRLLSPRVYSETRTVAFVFADLVNEIYPNAVIVFDDNSNQEQLGRQLIIEKDRMAGLYDLATSLGKIMFWDREGFLRVEDAPDEDQIVWDANAGADGVLVNPSREMTRDEVYNAWVVTGEGGDSDIPARAVAVDDSNGLTRFGGPFGKVRWPFSSPFITTDQQALVAAIAGLRRTLGAPYVVNFNAVTNPQLQPWEAVRITYRDGNRDVHVIESLTIPLDTSPMSATTREQRLSAVLTSG